MITAFLKEKSERVEAALAQCFLRCHTAPAGLLQSMRYSVDAGGKRLRPALVLGACELICGDDEPALPAACAIEMVHTYSLIHDDLPAMDNDDFRRGKPTCHKQFGEATAILAGDALLTLAFYELAQTGNTAAVRELADAAGPQGMVGGQYLDMQAEGRDLELKELEQIHAGKTGALITASLRLGGLSANADKDVLSALTAYGRSLGLLFQITDDILDVVGDADALGKSTGKDARSSKATYPALLGIDRSRVLAAETAERACHALARFGPEADRFRALAHFMVDRDR